MCSWLQQVLAAHNKESFGVFGLSLTCVVSRCAGVCVCVCVCVCVVCVCACVYVSLCVVCISVCCVSLLSLSLLPQRVQANKRASLFSLSFRLRCCDRQQMEYITDTITEATQIFLDESLAEEEEEEEEEAHGAH